MANVSDEKAAVLAAARRMADETGVSARVLLAVAIVETAGVPHARFDDRREPLIRFEGHYFDRLLQPKARTVARAAGLSAAKAGGVPNPASQAARWRLLDRASAIDPAAAFASTSWGLGQVMGSHWKALGYRDPQALAAEVRGSVEGQFRVMAAFLRIGELHKRLERGDIAGFSRLYNGPAFAKNRYDQKIAKAYAEAGLWLTSPAPESSPSDVEAIRSVPETATQLAPEIVPKPAEGWSKRGSGLSAISSWIQHLFSIRAATRFFSTSTARSSASATIPPPSASNLPS